MTDKQSIFINIAIAIVFLGFGIIIGDWYSSQSKPPYMLVTEATGVNKSLYLVSDKSLIPVQGDIITIQRTNLGKSGAIK